jgi:hypothetical protein
MRDLSLVWNRRAVKTKRDSAAAMENNMAVPIKIVNSSLMINNTIVE